MLIFKPSRYVFYSAVFFLYLIFGFTKDAHCLNIETVKVYYLSGDYKEAIKEGEGLIARDKYSSELRYLLGLSYLKEGDYQRSAENFKIVINNFKEVRFKEEARLGLADTYLLRGDSDNARRLYQELIKENPKTKFKEHIYSRLNDIDSKKSDSREFVPDNSFYSVQVGSFSNIKNARRLNQKLINKGYPAYIENSGSVYRVKVGRLKTRSQAEGLSRKLSAKGYSTKICP